jgi:hypothetical protein
MEPHGSRITAPVPWICPDLGISSSGKSSARQGSEGSVIPAAVTVGDAQGERVSLLDLFARQPGDVNVLFIFGGGDLGSGLPGHLWCQDSFEDTHILRTLCGSVYHPHGGEVSVRYTFADVDRALQGALID